MHIRSFKDGTVGRVDTCRYDDFLGFTKETECQDVLFLREYLQNL